MNDHALPRAPERMVRVEERPLLDRALQHVPGLHSTWIRLDNPAELNAYTTDGLKELILALRAASCDRASVAVVLTGTGTRAFCAGGNTREYATVYAGRPEEYRQYMRLFNDAVTGILTCDKPVICRVNGLRVGGGQELGTACDFSIAQDLARFGQAGPRHGSAPDGGATDFLPLYVGIEQAMVSCTLCEQWSAHKAYRFGLLTDIVPALHQDGDFIPNPLVDLRWTDERGKIVYGEPLRDEALTRGKETLARGEVRLDLLDRAVESLVTKLAETFPGCLLKTIESVRKHKLFWWDRNREQNRQWLALNMVTEAAAGFRAFEEGPRDRREVDFFELRRRIAAGEMWTPALSDAIQPRRDGGGR